MLHVLPYIAITAAIAGLFYYFVYYNRDLRWIWKGLDQECGIPKSQAPLKFRQRTPQGAEVISVVRVPDNMLRNLEIGIENMLARHRRSFPEWKNKDKVSDYRFVIINKNFVNVETEPGAPSISRMGLHTAGTTLGCGPHPACKQIYIVAPSQEDVGWRYTDYWMRTAWYEGEHDHERANSLPRFLHFAVEADQHPHEDYPDIPVIPAV
jgi:hypothetical protein